MYKTVVTDGNYYDKTIQLHKNYRTKLHLPTLFKVSVGSSLFVVIIPSIVLAIVVSAQFLWLLSILMLIGFLTGMAWDIHDFEFKPYKKGVSEEHVGATKGVQYRLLDQLHDTMQFEEVDNFSNRQDLASEIFNLIKVHRADKSLVDEGELVQAEYKLRDIEAEARQQRKEIKLAGLHAETPALDMAAAIVRKKD